MPINTQHPKVAQLADAWQLVADAASGSRAVKAAGDRYLPRLAWRRDPQKRFEAYKLRADFEGVTGRTWEGLLGLVFRKPPRIDVPASAQALVDDVTGTDVGFEQFARRVFGEVLVPGRCAVLVDSPPEGNGMPYATIYTAANVVSWRVERIEGQLTLTSLILREERDEPDPRDPYTLQCVEQYRECVLAEGVYSQRVWRKQTAPDGRLGQWAVVEAITPQRAEEALNFIPAVCFNPSSTDWDDVADPPLYDLAALNVSAYRTSADLEHGRHYCGVPQPYAFGVDVPKGQELEIGSGVAWTTPNAEAKAGYVEFTGQGLAALERAIEQKREQMAAMGARLLLPPKMVAETAAKKRLDDAGENSVLAVAARSVQEGLEGVLALLVWWYARDASTVDAVAETIEVELNTDFELLQLAPVDVLALVQAWQGGPQGAGMSRSTYLYQLARGGILPPGRTPEDEAALMDAEPPPMSGLTGPDELQ